MGILGRYIQMDDRAQWFVDVKWVVGGEVGCLDYILG